LRIRDGDSHRAAAALVLQREDGDLNAGTAICGGTSGARLCPSAAARRTIWWKGKYGL
jgi:hypothetical protein